MLFKSIISIFTCLLSMSIWAQETDTANVSKEIVFASDTQAPMWIETLVLRSNNNRAATKNIFNNMVTRNPAAVYLLGDVVSLGSSNRQWKPMDAYLKRLRSKGIKVNAALGNHEVLGQSGKGQKKFQVRFPKHNKTGSLDITDSVAVILLNSNFNSLTTAEDADQMGWYKQTLEKLDEDPSIRFIITGCHHSPYTNSKIVSSSISVREKFVPFFMQSRKSRLFLSGHSHNFEHFQQQGKDFFVIGGGGGLHQPLKQGQGLLADLSANYKPLFHYLSVQREGDKLKLISIRLTPDFKGFEEGATFEINGAINTLAAISTTPTHRTTSIGF
ncbi:metallophosphoesterase family protein [Segetibacter aerophilus]|nr:metallophosphoesterase [Segetibacter aerophilus]